MLLASAPVSAQVSTGFPPYGSFGGGPFDTVDNANLNVHFVIPILAKAGRGLPFAYSLAYDSSIWYPSGTSGSQYWTQVANWGWSGINNPLTGYLSRWATTDYCTVGKIEYPYVYFTFGPYVDPAGTIHSIYVTTNTGSTECEVGAQPSGTSKATDGSGLTLVVTNTLSASIMLPSGTTVVPPVYVGGAPPTSGTWSVTDTNGNELTTDLTFGTTTYTDTLGTTALTVSGSGTPSSPITLTYTAPSGNPVSPPITINYTQYTVQTNFGCSGISESGAAQENLVSSITLPDGTSYSFQYEATPGNSANTTGRLYKVTLPTGGYITYSYSGGSNGITCADGSAATLTREVTDPVSGASATWTYAHSESGAAWTTTLTDPQGNVTTFNSQGIYETERQVASLGTVYTCYNGASSPCNSTSISLPITERAVTTALSTSTGGTVESETNTYYNSYGLVTKVDEYDFGSGAVGAFKRETMSCPYAFSNTYIQNRPQYVMVYSATGNPSSCTGTSGLVAETTYGYDSNGNLLTEAHTNTGGSPSSISRSFTYGSYGVLNTSTDFKGHTTTYTNTACNNSFPTTITLPITSLSYSLQWNCNGAVVTSVTDPNSQPTTYTYGDPNFWRLTEIGYPDTGITQITYTDSANDFQIAISRLLSGSTYHTVTQYLDGLGRVIKSVDTQACSEVDTTYDSLGRVYTVSNPYCGTSSGATTYGYDALSRVTSITYPDTGATGVTYPACTVSTAISASLTDPAGKQRVICSDALGRVTSVTEDPGQTPHFNYQTTYTYDDLNDLVAVSQGSQTRTYSYDMLARLTSAQTPEAGTTSYSYAVSGSPCSGSPSSPCSRTDARGITTTYSYDALNRLLGKTHSDSTPPADFFYDQAPGSWPAWSGVSFANAKGRLVLACTNTTAGTCTSPATAVAYSYDPVGRIANFWQCNPSNCGSSSIWNVQYNYDKAGDITTWVDPAGFTLTNSVNSAQQVTAVQSSWQDSTHPQYLVQSAAYTPWGAVSQLENGCVGTSCTPAVETVETYTFNNRLQTTGIQLGTTSNSSQYASLTYNYNLPGGTQPPGCPINPAGTSGNNGNVIGYTYTDAVNSGFSHSAFYVYDSLNRLACAQATGNSTYNVAFTCDRYGNMACSLNSYTNNVKCPEWTYNTSTNQLTYPGCAYDAAGNTTEDCSTGHTFQWDAEGRVSSVDSGNTYAFTYNAVGNRVQWAYPGGADQHMFDPAGNWLGNAGEYSVLWWGRTFLAAYEGSETYLNHLNGIGSTTMLTNHAGTPAEDMLFYLWGDVWQSWGTGGYNFANQPFYDTNTYTSPSMFRFYSMGLGRWLSPDPLGGDASNPQSLNRYAYVMNNPTSAVDPLGLQGQCPPGSAQAGICRNGTFYPPGGPVYPWNPFTNPGWNWDEFDLMNIPVVTTTYTWVPPQLVTIEGGLPGGGIALVEFYFGGYWTTGTQVGSGIDLTASIGASGSLLSSVGSALDSAYGTALGALGKVFRGRPPGQSFGGCIANNVNRTFWDKLQGSWGAVTAGISGMTGTALTVTTVGPGLSLSTYLALIAGGGSVTSSSITATLPVLGAALTTGKAVAIVGGAGLGLLIGSAANCASVGVGP